MNKIILKAQLLYGDMGKSEKKVADWLISHPGDNLPMSISELAELCESSESTIVRFARRLGFSGYGELKISVAGEQEKKVVLPTIDENDSCFEILGKICNDAYLSFERTKRTIAPENIAAAANLIAGARKTVLIGLGSSASVAQDAANKFLRAGYEAFSYGDTHMQMIAVSRMRAGDVLVGISQSGASKDIVEAMRLAKSRGISTICITGTDRSPVMKQSDIVLLTDTEETKHSSLALSSHLSRLVVIDSLCYYLVYRNEANRGNFEDENQNSLKSKRVNEANE
ncbi:MAG: MurR/RpiR family transcriptional regulator [Clostridia bacterium]|nr:MurR/RpiR family transcriptional regulator [Clostridia bacterium]MBQ8861120.1 MurR/RpiR family transcriptional regulator [Clostridia bacterium]MBQ9710620.1 MurR/RpiR family transcriptional regulator [Clostridia bacterium]